MFRGRQIYQRTRTATPRRALSTGRVGGNKSSRENDGLGSTRTRSEARDSTSGIGGLNQSVLTGTPAPGLSDSNLSTANIGGRAAPSRAGEVGDGTRPPGNMANENSGLNTDALTMDARQNQQAQFNTGRQGPPASEVFESEVNPNRDLSSKRNSRSQNLGQSGQSARMGDTARRGKRTDRQRGIQASENQDDYEDVVYNDEEDTTTNLLESPGTRGRKPSLTGISAEGDFDSDDSPIVVDKKGRRGAMKNKGEPGERIGSRSMTDVGKKARNGKYIDE